MSIERAREKTKLGKTPFVTTKHSSWGDKKHTMERCAGILVAK